MVDDLDLLIKLDRLLCSKDPTVIDALKSALVLVEVAEVDDGKLKDNDGPFMRMYSRIADLQHQIDMLKNSRAGMGENNPYQNVTWTDNTSGWTGSQWADPTRNYPHGYQWDHLTKSVIKTTTGTGT